MANMISKCFCIDIGSPNVTGTGTVTNAYGLYISDITGIGTSNNFSLRVNGQSTFDDRVGIGTTGAAAFLEIDTDAGDNLTALIVDQDDTTNNNIALDIQNAGSGNSLQVNTSDFVVDGSGQVGIGTGSPSEALTIGDGSTADYDLLLNKEATATSGNGQQSQRLIFRGSAYNSGSPLDSDVELYVSASPDSVDYAFHIVDGSGGDLLYLENNGDFVINADDASSSTNLFAFQAIPANALVSGWGSDSTLTLLARNGTQDAYINVNTAGSDDWTFGLDDSDSQAFVLSRSATLGNNFALRVDATTRQLSFSTSVYDCSSNANGGALTINASGVMVCSDDDGGTGSSEWTDGTGFLYPNGGTSNVILGSTAEATADINLYADGSAVFNQQSNDADFRIESNGDENMFFLNAGTDQIGIGVDPSGYVGNLVIADNFSPSAWAALSSVELTVSGSSASTNVASGLIVDVTNQATGAGYSEASGIKVYATTANDAGVDQYVYALGVHLESHSNDEVYGLAVVDENSSTGGSAYGVFIDLDDTDVTRYGIYQNSANDNYFAGNIGIGEASPTAFLQIAAPTTSAASLRLTASSAVDPSSPNIGDMWFNGTNLYFRKDGSTSVDLLAGGGSTGDQAAASFYDNTGGTTISSSADTVITLDTTQRNNATGVFGLASNEVTISEDADYLITYEVTGTLGAGTRSGMFAKLELDTGGGYADVDGSLAYNYGRLTTETSGTSSGSVILSLTDGDKVRLVAQGTTQAFTSVADGSRMTFVQLKGPKGDTGAAGSGGGLFTQGTNLAYLTTTTDDLVLGGNSVATADILLGDTGSAVFNEQGNDVDFRVESDANENMLFVDASTSFVGIGTNAPTHRLHVFTTGTSARVVVEATGVNSSAQFSLKNDAIDWQVGVNLLDNFRIRDNTGGNDVFTIESGASANSLYIDSTGNVGIGDSNPTEGRLVIKGTNTEAVEGAEMISALADRDFSSDTGKWTGGATWTVDNGDNNIATHTAGDNNFTLDNTALTTNPVGGSTYAITFRHNASTAGGATALRVCIGGACGPWVGSDLPAHTETHVISANNTSALYFDTDATWAGTIDSVSIKEVTVSTSVLTLNNDNSSIGLEVRSGGAGDDNVFIGVESGKANTTGWENTALGHFALSVNTVGAENTAIGAYSLQFNTTGDANTAVGASSLYNNTVGVENTAIGIYSLEANTTGNYNTAVGASALAKNTSGFENTAVGTYSLQANTVGFENSSLGLASLLSNTTGAENTAIGSYSLQRNTTGDANVALGSASLYRNLSGIENTAIGVYGLYDNETGEGNTVLGYMAGGNSNSSGIDQDYNVLLGHRAGYDNQGDYNVFLGYNSGQNNTSGNNNVFLGNQTGETNTTGSNNIVIGNNIDAQAIDSANTLTIGNTIFGTGISTTGTTIDANARIGIGDASPGARLDILVATAADVGLIVQGAVTQSGDMLQILSNTAVELVAVEDDGTSIFRVDADSANTFRVQDAGGQDYLNIDTTNLAVEVGGGTDDVLFVLDSFASDPGTAVAGAMYYNTTSDRFRCAQGSTPAWTDCIGSGGGGGTTVDVVLVPEFAGGVLKADGSNNSGTMTGNHDSTAHRNYYQWSTSQSSAQDTDIIVQVQIPDDYVGTPTGFKFWHNDPDGATTNANTIWSMIDDTGTSCFSTTFEGASSGVWEQETATFGSCTLSANEIVTFTFKLKTTSGAGNLQLGPFQFQYNN